MILTVVIFLVVLSILVFVHESGHYLAARHVGVRVLQFSIGFPPKLWGKIVGDTEYLVSWLPIGGYVRLEGQNIEDENPDDPANYASKSILQRLYILVAGPLANLLLALVLMPLVYLIGVETSAYRLEKPILAGTVEGSPAEKAGFEAGDRIISVGDQRIQSWRDLSESLGAEAVREPTVSFKVERGDRFLTLIVSSDHFLGEESFGWQPLIPAIVGRVGEGTPAEKAGLLPGDHLLSMNGENLSQWREIPSAVQRAADSDLAVEVERNGQKIVLKMRAELDTERQVWLIGISPPMVTERYGFGEAISRGTKRVWEITQATFSFLGAMLGGHGSMEAVGGPVKIGQVIGEAARLGVANLVFWMAVISLQLGIFNLLPIPALDGGHVVLLGAEYLRGKPLSSMIRERAQMIGFSLLILLLVFVTFNDISRLIN